MEFTHTFHVPVDIDTTFTTLIDLEKVTPCLPGATLEEVDGDTYTGRVKVKVGPIAVTYRGTARMVEKDRATRTARIEASGKEARGAGTARADVVATCEEVEGGTDVRVVTDLAITGKPAQFGRGVMQDVGNRIIDTFAERLQAMVTGGDEEPLVSGGEAVATGAAAVGAARDEGAARGGGAARDEDEDEDAARDQGAARDADGQPGPVREAVPSGPRRIAPDPSRGDDVLDLVEMAGPAAAKRLVPLVALLLAIGGLVWWLRER